MLKIFFCLILILLKCNRYSNSRSHRKLSSKICMVLNFGFLAIFSVSGILIVNLQEVYVACGIKNRGLPEELILSLPISKYKRWFFLRKRSRSER